VDDSLFDQKPREFVPPPRSSISATTGVGAPSGQGAAGETPPRASRFGYSDVMEQPRHEPAPTMTSDFFAEAARPGMQLGRSSSSFGSGHSAPGASTASLVTDVAQKRFGNAKSISSDAFAARDDAADQEKQARLARFQGASSISSDAFYGREEATSPEMGSRRNSYRAGGSGGGGGPDDDFDLTASELVQRMSVQAQEDLQQLKGMAQSAGRILSGLAASVMAELQER
jgi:ADP-ribosylation factor GTPase-activating protein 2/3